MFEVSGRETVQQKGKTMMKIEICTDCLSLLANGEVFDGDGEDIADEHFAKMVAVWGESAASFPTLGGEDQGFSWQWCDGCDSRLGGDRFDAYI